MWSDQFNYPRVPQTCSCCPVGSVSQPTLSTEQLCACVQTSRPALTPGEVCTLPPHQHNKKVQNVILFLDSPGRRQSITFTSCRQALQTLCTAYSTRNAHFPLRYHTHKLYIAKYGMTIRPFHYCAECCVGGFCGMI